MEYAYGSTRSEAPTGPQTLEHGFGHTGASSAGAEQATKGHISGSGASESSDPQNDSFELGKKGKSFKKEATISCAFQEESSTRRGKSATVLDTSEPDLRQRTCEVVVSEADIGSSWYNAIERKDCQMLMTILREGKDKDILLTTGKARRTALHVAAMQGSFELLSTIRGFFPCGKYHQQCAEKLTDAIDGRCGMNARNIATHIVGNRDRLMSLGVICGSRGVCECERITFTPFLALSADFWQSDYNLTRENVGKAESLITSVLEKGTYHDLIKSFENNVDYNFCSYEVHMYLFLFHHACSRKDGKDFVFDVIAHHDDVGFEQLMRLRDFQGRTPLHVVVAIASGIDGDYMLESLLRRSENWIHKFLGVLDGRGWTPLHLAATQPFSEAFTGLILTAGDEIIAQRIPDVSGGVDSGCCNAFHLAILHNNAKIVGKLLQGSQEHSLLRGSFWNVCQSWNVRLFREIYDESIASRVFNWWTPLSLALLLGNEAVVDVLLLTLRHEDMAFPFICFAASMGSTEILRHFLNDVGCDPFEMDDVGRTSLHYAAMGLIEPCIVVHTSLDWKIQMTHRHAYPCVLPIDVPNVLWLDELYESLPQVCVKKGYSGRKGCINMLLQAGVDIWVKDRLGKVANPGPNTRDDEFLSWWHERIAKETLDTRNSLNQGGNAISVIGALIATASYVGPLQPPLSYGSDFSPTSDNTLYAHVWDPLVKVFMLSNSLSFYFAIASIMLAVVPSLPMPQESLLNELERTRKTVASAICVLLLSVVGILVSYATASIAVLPKHTSFGNVCWTSYPALVGGLACLFGIVLFLKRVMRLMYPEKCRRFRKTLKMLKTIDLNYCVQCTLVMISVPFYIFYLFVVRLSEVVGDWLRVLKNKM